jgi:Cu2+-exporting ATPase
MIDFILYVAMLYSTFGLFSSVESELRWMLVILIGILLFGSWIRMRLVQQTLHTVNELENIIPETAERITDDGCTENIPVYELSEGDLVYVQAGTRFPADGIIKEGNSKIDESMIMADSKLTRKTSGDKVLAGTINGDSSLYVRITDTGDETRFAKIRRLIKEAQNIPC